MERSKIGAHLASSTCLHLLSPAFTRLSPPFTCFRNRATADTRETQQASDNQQQQRQWRGAKLAHTLLLPLAFTCFHLLSPAFHRLSPAFATEQQLTLEKHNRQATTSNNNVNGEEQNWRTPCFFHLPSPAFTCFHPPFTAFHLLSQPSNS